jgi:hypothetical protein
MTIVMSLLERGKELKKVRSKDQKKQKELKREKETGERGGLG